MDSLFDLMKLQGQVRVMLMQKFSIGEELALDIASEAVHLFAQSEIANDDCRSAYAELEKQQEVAG